MYGKVLDDLESMLGTPPGPGGASIAESLVQVRALRNQTFYRQGDPADGFYVVAHGAVMLEWSNGDGHPVAFRLALQGDTFGLRSLCAEEPRSTSARACYETLCVFLATETLERAGDLKPDVWRYIARCVGRDAGPRLSKLLHNGRVPATARLAYLLNHLCGRIPGREREREFELGTPVRQRDLATLLNVAEETLSRAFHALWEKGLVTHATETRGIRILDGARLVAEFRPYL